MKTPERPALHNAVCAFRGCFDHAVTARDTASGIRVGYCNFHSFAAHTLFDKPDASEQIAA